MVSFDTNEVNFAHPMITILYTSFVSIDEGKKYKKSTWLNWYNMYLTFSPNDEKFIPSLD